VHSFSTNPVSAATTDMAEPKHHGIKPQGMSTVVTSQEPKHLPVPDNNLLVCAGAMRECTDSKTEQL
jgi:hypothetical protein